MDEKKEIKPGFHFAKANGHKGYNVIVEVYGTSPFYKVRGWDFVNDRQVTDISHLDEVGDYIERP